MSGREDWPRNPPKKPGQRRGHPKTGKVNKLCIVLRRLIEECCPENWAEEEDLRGAWQSAADTLSGISKEKVRLPGGGS